MISQPETGPRRSRWTYFPEFATETLPRYTSYPPANRFSTDTDGAAATAALRALPAEAKLSLYLHIPYCRRLCWYCGCHTSVPTRADPLETYLPALHAEIDKVADELPVGAHVTHVHVGGGSPDILPPRRITALFDRLRSAFHVAGDAEIAVELDPRGATGDTVAALVDSGLTRASLGVQCLDEGVQRRINRVQPVRLVESAAARLRTAGVAGLNIDMMYGLPGQTVTHVVDTARFATRIGADRVAVFGYAHVPWFKKHQKAINAEELPDSEARFRQAEAAADALEANGYLPVGFDHFARPGDDMAEAARTGALRRNFQGYTTDGADAVIGLGASAISSLPGLFWQNTPVSAAYRTALRDDRLPVVRGARVNADDARRAALIEAILCRGEATPDLDLLRPVVSRLDHFRAQGLVEFDGRRIKATPAGRPYLRNIAASFDPDMTAASRRHSLAV